MRLVLAVVAGCLADVIGSFIAYAIFYFIIAFVENVPSEAALEEITRRPLVFASSWLIGAAFSVLGGFVAARIGRRSPLLLGGLSTIGAVLIGVGQVLEPPRSVVSLGMPFLVASILVTPLLGVAGGGVWRLRNR